MAWYALLVKRGCEHRVADFLNLDGVTTFVPVEIVYRQARGSRRSVSREQIQLIAPGYVFASEPDTSYRNVRGVLMINGVPAKIPEAAMAPLIEASGRVVEQTKRKPFRVGDLVRLKAGGHDGRAVTISRVHKGKVEVVLTLLGAPRTAQVNANKIEMA